MNLKLWLVGMLSNNRTDTETRTAANLGAEDGRELTRAYVSGFRQGVTEVLMDEMVNFHSVIETEAVSVETKPQKRLTKHH